MNTRQYTELEKVKLKIKALAAMTVSNGCSEEEALSAMHVVGRLLQQYNLTMNELDVRDASYKTIYMDIGRTRRHPIDHCVVALANFVDAKTWFQKQRAVRTYTPKYDVILKRFRPEFTKPIPQNSKFAFFGQESDMEIVEYLFKVILAAINTESILFKQSDDYRNTSFAKKSAYVAFQKGMATRISHRLTTMKKENDDALATAKSTGRALIVLKGQLTEDAFKKTGVKLTTNYNHSQIKDYTAWMAGHKAGEKVNLSRPLTDRNKVKGYLT